ncbi:MAG: tripartite tricarboxylate transporter substrate binding protein [Candidimonas sp.]
MKAVKFFAGLLCALALSAGAVAAENFPSKTVRIICPYSPGGTVDILARVMADRLSEYWGQQVIVENRPGVAGQVATRYVATQPADGYTWLITASGHPINHLLYKDLPYDGFKDFSPVTQLGRGSLVLVVNKDSKFATLADFLAEARQGKDKLTYGHVGIGTSSWMGGALLEHMTGVKLLGIPYKGGVPALTDLMGGQIDSNFNIIPEAIAQIKAGSVKALATTGEQRAQTLPDVPTIGETVPGYSFGAYWIILGPAGVPDDIVAKVNEGMNRALKEPAVIERLSTLGVEPMGTTPEQVAELMREDAKKWKPIFDAAGIQPQ